jgi:glycosyltransferase involved in cell wall biosynthesis
MKVTLLTTYKSGGAGIACQRLANALVKEGIDARILTQDKESHGSNIHSISQSPIGQFKNKIRLAKELFPFILNEKTRQDRFKFSLAIEGIDISNHPLILDSDIIHLHWINQGFLSLNSIRKLQSLGKPIVWTLHDMWAFTGGCHYTGNCRAFEKVCGLCPYLRNPSPHDLSYKTWVRKNDLYKNSRFTFVTCSNWLKSEAEKSSLVSAFQIESIPNPIDVSVFAPAEKKLIREQMSLPENAKVILFGAMNLEDKRKGFDYLHEALQILASRYPNVHSEVEIVVFGKANQGEIQFPFNTRNLGIVRGDDHVRKIYSAADVFVLPSLEDNLPNTIMESMACGTPVAGFLVGGIPEMVDHLKNGFIAEHKSAEDLAEGIYTILYRSDSYKLGQEARKKVIDNYSEEIIARKYIKLYDGLL